MVEVGVFISGNWGGDILFCNLGIGDARMSG